MGGAEDRKLDQTKKWHVNSPIIVINASAATVKKNVDPNLHYNSLFESWFKHTCDLPRRFPFFSRPEPAIKKQKYEAHARTCNRKPCSTDSCCSLVNTAHTRRTSKRSQV